MSARLGYCYLVVDYTLFLLGGYVYKDCLIFGGEGVVVRAVFGAFVEANSTSLHYCSCLGVLDLVYFSIEVNIADQLAFLGLGRKLGRVGSEMRLDVVVRVIEVGPEVVDVRLSRFL